MTPESRDRPLDKAREALLRARVLLREPSPSNVNLCRASLAAAAETVEALLEALRKSKARDRGLLDAAIVLHNEVRIVATLLDNAASFHGNLLQAMLAAAPEQPAPAPRCGIHLRA